MTRRSLLEWLGTGCVLALSSPLLSACSDPGPTPTERGDAGADLASGDSARGDSTRADATVVAGDGGFPFEPGEKTGPLFESWNVRTVDPQDVAKILASWKLRIDGLVEAPVTLSFAELLALQRHDMVTDFHCVEGWSVLDVPWNGVQLSTIFELVNPTAGATHVTFHTIDGKYNESLPLEVAREPRTILGYGVAGSTLPLQHGFPLRVVIPRLLGYKSAKYIDRIELADKPVHGFWVAAGYPYDGEVPPERLRPGKY